MTANEYKLRTKKIAELTQDLFDRCGYTATGSVTVPRRTDDTFFVDGCEAMLFHLDIALRQYEYLASPIDSMESVFYDDENGIYLTERQVFRAGDRIEFCFRDKDTKQIKWALSHIEYSEDQGGYYIYGYADLDLNGMVIRYRK